MKRYKRSAQEDKNSLSEKIKREPELSSYLKDPEGFSAYLSKKKLIFFYRSNILESSLERKIAS